MTSFLLGPYNAIFNNEKMAATPKTKNMNFKAISSMNFNPS
jgi:hypothetical protein